MSQNLVVVNADGPEVRVGVVENGRLAELFLERKRDRGLVGNIYKAKVKRILPGMQAAFVALGSGVEKDAFLYAGDVVGAVDDLRAIFGEDTEIADPDGEGADGPEGGDGGDAAGSANGASAKSSKKSKPVKRGPRKRIEDLLKERQEVLVQIVKDPIAHKGARVTGFLSLAGRYLVFMPMVAQSGVSRRIGSDRERKRVRKLIESARPAGTGFIARTAAETAGDDEVREDAEFLVGLWRELGRRAETTSAPGLVYADLDLVLRCIRDRLTDDIDAVFIDTEAEYERARKFASAFMPRWVDRIRRYDGRRPIFDFYGLEPAVRTAMEREVPLKSGGSLVIDQGEALTSIDINTGRFVGKRDLEETITKNNLEACEEIVNQLRLRNIGGIIVIDFVDMEKESNRKKVFNAFQKALEADHSRSNVTKISELGLVEMTRKRTRESLNQILSEKCSACSGRGSVKSPTTVAYEILRELRRLGGTGEADSLEVSCASRVADILRSQELDYIDDLEKRFHKKINIKGGRAGSPETFSIGGTKGGGAGTGSGGGSGGGPGGGSGGGSGGGPGGGNDEPKKKRNRGRRGGRGRGKRTGAGNEAEVAASEA